MNRQSQHVPPSLAGRVSRLVGQNHCDKSVKGLPANTQEQAFRSGACERFHRLRHTSYMLRALLTYVLCIHGFRQLGRWAALIDPSSLFDTPWRKRLEQIRAWLVWLLLALLPRLRHCQPSSPATVIERVLLVDTGRFKREGGTGSEWQLQGVYDLREKRLLQVYEGDQRQAELLEHFQLWRGDLVITDRGYSSPRNVAYASGQQAHVILAFMPSTCPLLDRYGQPLDVMSWLRQLKGGTHYRICWCEYEGRRYQVRIIAHALGGEEAAQVRKHEEQQAGKGGQQVPQDTLVLASWVLLLCTLPKRPWSSKQVLLLYRALGQVEPLFRRMKQMLRLHLGRARTPESYEVRTCLSGWSSRLSRKRRPSRHSEPCNRSPISSRLRRLPWGAR